MGFCSGWGYLAVRRDRQRLVSGDRVCSAGIFHTDRGGNVILDDGNTLAALIAESGSCCGSSRWYCSGCKLPLQH